MALGLMVVCLFRLEARLEWRVVIVLPKYGSHGVCLDVGFVGEASSCGFEVLW